MSYTAITGGWAVTISGVPGGAGAAVTVSGPGGFSQSLSQSLTLTGLVPGVYSITGAAISSEMSLARCCTDRSISANGDSAATPPISVAPPQVPADHHAAYVR